MLKLNINSIKNIVVLAVAVLVTACTTVPNSEISGLKTPVHKHLLSIQSPDKLLTDGMVQFLNSPFISTYPTQKIGGYTLSLTKKANNTPFFNKPQLFGMLRKEIKPASFITTYKLSSYTGEIITKGEVITIGEDRPVITPSISRNTKLTTDIIADIARQIKPILEQTFVNIKWQPVVIGKHDYRHVVIQSSKKEGVKIGDMFTAPNNALLQIVTFDEISDLAVLTVLDGLLPSIGIQLSAVIIQK